MVLFTLFHAMFFLIGSVNDIIGIVFQYIKLLKSKEPVEWIFKELKVRVLWICVLDDI